MFIRFGGHKQAAGLTMEACARPGVPVGDQRSRRPIARARAVDAAPAHRQRPGLPRDHGAGGSRDCLAGAVRSRQSRPVFAARRVEVIDGPRKLKERHLKMSLRQDGRVFRAVAWRAAEKHDQITDNKTAHRRRVLARAEPVQRRNLRRADARRHQTCTVMKWQRTARLVIAVVGIAFAIVVGDERCDAAPRRRAGRLFRAPIRRRSSSRRAAARSASTQPGRRRPQVPASADLRQRCVEDARRDAHHRSRWQDLHRHRRRRAGGRERLDDGVVRRRAARVDAMAWC